MYDERTTWAPLVLFEYDHKPGNYCLMLSDRHMVGAAEAVFTANGREGNGYGWSDVALQAIRTQAPELEQRVSMDPEAGTFVAYGADLPALQELAKLLHQAFHDAAVLGPLVAGAPYEYD